MGEIIFVELYKTKRIMHNGYSYYNEDYGVSANSLDEIRNLIDQSGRNTSRHS